MLYRVALFLLIAQLLAVALPSPGSEIREKVVAADFGLTIIGTIISKDNNIVLIKFKETGKVKAHRVGFPIYQKYTITEIQSHFIVLKSEEGAATKVTVVYKDGFIDTNITGQGSKAGADFGKDSYQEEGFERSGNAIEMSESYRDTLIQQDLPKVLMQASAEPVVEQGQIVGFMIDQIDPNSIYAKAGLKNGDVVTSINDISLQDITATIKLLHSLKKSKEISMELKRNGKVIPVHVKVK